MRLERFMRGKVSGVAQTKLLGLFFSTFGLLSCSERVVSQSLTDPRSPTFKKIIQDSADNRAEKDPLGIALLSLPASETSLEAFASAVESARAQKYRFTVESGKFSNCSSFGPLKPLSELLSFQTGPAGDKTICLQAADESGRLGKISRFSFKKIADASEFPEPQFEGIPQGFTALSQTTMSLVTQNITQYRASLTAVSAPIPNCKTLENNPWKDSNQSISLKFAYDGPWLFCVEVRDKNGRKTPAPRAFTWTRDTVYPVANRPDLPEQPTIASEFTFNVSGNLVDFYQFTLVEGESNCTGVNYSPVTPIATPLNFKIPKDGVWTFCLQTENKSGLRQQAPLVHKLQKVSPVQSNNSVIEPGTPTTNPTLTPVPDPSKVPTAKVKLNTLTVNRFLQPTTPARTFTISGNNVTHYKAVSYDSSTTCPTTLPASMNEAQPEPVSKTLSILFKTAESGLPSSDPGHIRTLCVWGIHRSDNGVDILQATPTWFRFYNNTSYSMKGKSLQNVVPFTLAKTGSYCNSCHTFGTQEAWQRRAVSASIQLRLDLMPKDGWTDAEKAGAMAFLETIPGYPVDLPFIIAEQ